MKKYFSFLLVALIGFVAISCVEDRVDDPYIDNDTYSVVYDATGSFTAANFYTLTFDFPQKLYKSDVVLVYRRTGVDNGNNVWKQIPNTIYFSNGDELDYGFDFTVNDVQIFAQGNYDISTTPTYLTNQTFRIVIVPASFGKANVDFSDYNAVVKYFKINDTQVKSL